MKIPQKMQALVAREAGSYGLEEIAVPTLGPHDILLRTEACGICAGDVKAVLPTARFWGGDGMPGYCEPPFVPGHEFVGRVVARGEHVPERFALGTRLVSEQIVPCGECRYCRRGQYWLCAPHNVYGFKHFLNGGMAEYVRLPKGSINHLVPEGMPLEQAVLIEPYACSLHGVRRASIQVDDVVVLAGAGTLGLGMISAIKRRNPRLLIVLDMLDHRLKKALAFGADIAINPGKEDALAQVMAQTEGHGCDVYLEVTGHPSAVQQGLDMIAKGGRFVEFSVMSGTSTVDWSIIGDAKEITIYGSQLSPYCFEPTIRDMVSGQARCEGVVSHQFPLAAWQEAFQLAESGQALRVIIRP